jgi:hypothetical protein
MLMSHHELHKDNENSTSGNHDQHHHIHPQQGLYRQLQHYLRKIILKACGLLSGAVRALFITAKERQIFLIFFE